MRRAWVCWNPSSIGHKCRSVKSRSKLQLIYYQHLKWRFQRHLCSLLDWKFFAWLGGQSHKARHALIIAILASKIIAYILHYNCHSSNSRSHGTSLLFFTLYYPVLIFKFMWLNIAIWLPFIIHMQFCTSDHNLQTCATQHIIELLQINLLVLFIHVIWVCSWTFILSRNDMIVYLL